jgi:hypothetical protein
MRIVTARIVRKGIERGYVKEVKLESHSVQKEQAAKI